MNELHQHQWRTFKGYGKRAWRCTTAVSRAEIENREPCPAECVIKHKHYIEIGCLGTCVQYEKDGKFFFCAPGASMIECDGRPVAMLMDDEYMDKLTAFYESMRQNILEAA